MSKSKPRVHLVCNAHLDPIWQWKWEEGMTEALATFEVAADLLDEYPEFVFNHNEALLYEWVREYRPVLFARIRKHVADGRWVIGGGWYLQPDCNLPCGESFVRQGLLGRTFFRQAFGVVPTVAYNFDSFGHHGNLPQLLRKMGYALYVHFRPHLREDDEDAPLYRWRGIDGSEIATLRPPCRWYNTATTEHLERKIAAMLELSRNTGRDVTLFWGAGDHGGGATRSDLNAIRKAARANPGLTHSSLEAYWNAARHETGSAPTVTGELQKCFTGCYTSVMDSKQRNRRGEGLALAAERTAALAWWILGEPYPRKKLADVWRKVLFNQFHDILPGSSVRDGYRDSAEIYGHAFTQAREILATAQLCLLRHRKRRKPLPFCIFNPQARRRRKLVEFEFTGATNPGLLQGKMFRITDGDRRTIACQKLQEEPRLAYWRQRFAVEADLPALGMAEYRIHVENGEPPPSKKGVQRRLSGKRLRFATRHYSVTFDTQTGLLHSLRDRATGKEFLAKPGSVLLVREDGTDSWGPHNNPYGRTVGRFRCPGKRALSEIVGAHSLPVAGPVRIIEEGPLLTRIEVIQTYSRSLARLRYTLAANHPEIGIEILLNWGERCRALQFEFPTSLDATRYRVEIPHGFIERDAGNDEEPCGRWVLLLSGNRTSALAVVNNGPGGVDVDRGLLRQTLLRSPMFCTMGMPIDPNRLNEHMDQGEHIFRFALRFGATVGVHADLPTLAEDLCMPPSVHVHLPLGPDKDNGITAGRDLVDVKGTGIHLAALKQSEDGKGLILRLVETRGRRRKAGIRLAGMRGTPLLSFTPFEIKTLRVTRRGRSVKWQECDLLERPVK